MIEVSHWPDITTIVMSGYIGLIRIALPTDRAIDVGQHLKQILMAHVARDFDSWLRGSLRDDPGRPSPRINGEATFERGEGLSIDVRSANGRVTLTLESELSYILLTMEHAVAFRLWRALHPMSG